MLLLQRAAAMRSSGRPRCPPPARALPRAAAALRGAVRAPARAPAVRAATAASRRQQPARRLPAAAAAAAPGQAALLAAGQCSGADAAASVGSQRVTAGQPGGVLLTVVLVWTGRSSSMQLPQHCTVGELRHALAALIGREAEQLQLRLLYAGKELSAAMDGAAFTLQRGLRVLHVVTRLHGG